jgi:hypothetical protein
LTLEVFRRGVLHDCQLLEGLFWLYWYHLVIRVVDSDPLNYFLWSSSAILSFELWTPIPRIITLGPAAPSYHSSCGFRSLGFFLFGQQRHWLIRVMDFGLTGHLFTTYPCATRFAGFSVYYLRVFDINIQVYAFRPSVPLL